MSRTCALGDVQEKRHQVMSQKKMHLVMSHTCVLGDGQEKRRHQVMSHLCVRGWSREEEASGNVTPVC